jgi:ADP-ribose pyrophosphatase
MIEWQKISQYIKRVGYRPLIFKTFKLPDGNTREFTTFGAIDSRDAAVIALTEDKQVIIARQYRPGPEQLMDELPGGAVEPGEDIETGARRELKEETGFASKQFSYLGKCYRSAYENSTTHYYLALNCYKEGEPEPDEFEYIEVATIPIEQLIANARNGKMIDSPAVLLAMEMLNKIKSDLNQA